MPNPSKQLTAAEFGRMVAEAERIAASATMSRLEALRAGLIPLMATTDDELVFVFRSAVKRATLITN